MRLFLLLSLFAFNQGIGQTTARIHIVHADLNLGRKVDNQQLRILKGAVHVMRDTIHMYCDSAYYYEDENRLEMLGNVRVLNGDRVVRSQSMTYLPDEELIEGIGQVRQTSSKDSLYAHRVLYNMALEEGTATDSVYIFGKENNVIVTGNYAYIDQKKDYFQVKEQAHFISIDTTTSDSFQVSSQRLEYYNDSTAAALAVDSVKIWQGNLTAQSDTAWYFSKVERAVLKGKPFAWYENNELSGTIINVQMDSSEVERLFVEQNAKAKTITDSVKNEYNLLTGKTIEFFITDNTPQKVISRYNSSSKYYLSEGADAGINYSTSDSIYVFFKEGEVDSIEIIGGSQGTYYPEGYKGEIEGGDE